MERVFLFRRLDIAAQQRYLQLLSLQERTDFLKELGEKARWYGEDFQVEEVDRDLEQFGYDFFAVSSGGFEPEKLAPVGPDYVIGPGDSLIISIWGNLDGRYEVSVERNGEIVLPRIGAIYVWGQTFSQVKETIRKQVAKYFTGFDLNVTLGALRTIQVFMVGELNAPGTYNVSSLSTVLTALTQAGGAAKTGSLRHVQLRRNGELVSIIDFYDFLLNGKRSSDERLQSGDTIFVPVVGAQVGVAGDVRRPAIYEIKAGETLKKVLAMAGGVTSTAYLGNVQVERVEAHRKKVVLDLDLSGDSEGGSGLETVLQDRDLVKVSPISAMTENYVRLSGYVARPGRYQLTPGLRVASLILLHDNLLPDYFPGVAEILRLQPPEYRPEKITIDLHKALKGDPANNITLQEFDEVRLFSREDMEELPEVLVSGAVMNPGVYRLYDHMTIKDLVANAGNLKRRAYLAEAEITRFIPDGKETRVERMLIDLKRALEGEPAHNLVLQPDDHFFVRSIPDFGEKMMVEVHGQVLFPGSYVISRGETLSSVLERAGGFSGKAYLRGAVFSRESLKETQRKRLEQLIFEQEQEILEVSAELNIGALSKEDVESSKALLENRKQILQKLKEAPVTGRMVVHLLPLEEFRGSEYDIELSAGDNITIPENPRSVTVLGQVYNPTSLVYRAGKTVAYYLSRVGGPEKDAEIDEMFIVRSDGSVFSKQQGGRVLKWDSENWRWITGGFDATELYPGDTLLVPQKVRHVDIMREVKDITTILYQMALGAAAVASF